MIILVKVRSEQEYLCNIVFLLTYQEVRIYGDGTGLTGSPEGTKTDLVGLYHARGLSDSPPHCNLGLPGSAMSGDQESTIN